MGDSRPPAPDDTVVADTVREMREVPEPAVDDTPLVAGRYRIVAMLGAGAMGTVYRARDTELDEIVALKVLRRELATAAGLLDRFRQEVKLSRKVTHPNVARVFDIGEHEGERFFTMELVEGESLADVIEREGAMPLARVAAIVHEIAAGLEAAHKASVVHRDLKPENVLVARDGRVVVTDFGVARALAGASKGTTGGGFVGTPAYMAPEQVEGKEVDGRADVYALGEIAFELATGKHPWPGTEPIAVAFMRLGKPPPDPSAHRSGIPPAFGEAVLRAMARDRDARTPTPTRLAAELDAALAADAANVAHATGATGSQDFAPSTAPRSLRAPNELSIAVLPFSSDTEGEDPELAVGITAELVDALAMTSRLRVHPRVAANAADPVAIGRDLAVDAVVVGTFRKTERGFRVSARVISVTEGYQLLARRFDCSTHDLLRVTDEIAHGIASALSTTMPVPVRKAAHDGTAVALYLRARAVTRTGWHLPGPFAPAVGLIDEALRRAPHDPTILAGWAIIHARKAFLRAGGSDQASDLSRARAAAERVVTESPHIGEAWIALATVRWLSHDNVGLGQALAGALAASPSLARAHDMLGRLLLEHGEMDAAVARLERALDLDPGALDIRYEIARAHALARRWDACDALFALPVDESAATPHAVFGARYALWRGVRDPSFAWPTQRYLSAQPALMFELFAGIIRTGALDVAAMRGLEEATAGSPRLDTMTHQLRTEAYLAVGDVEAAIAALDQSIRAGLLDLAWMDRLPLADGVRATDPRWNALRARVAERVLPALETARTLGLVSRASPAREDRLP